MMKNHLDHPVIGVFEDTYPAPDDQIATEFDLRDRFAREFPESVALLHDALANIQRVSGITIPISGVSDLNGRLGDGLIDKQGNFTGRPDWCRLTLGLEQWDLDVGDQLPEATSQMLVGIYSLLGASVTSDGFWDVGQFCRRDAIRQGIYFGSPVYVSEVFQLLHAAHLEGGGYYTYSVSVYNEADRRAMQPTPSEET